MALLSPGDPLARADDLRTRFADRFGRRPDVVGRAPGRVNLIGEHTDYNGGLCLPVALPHATLAAVGVRDDATVRLASAQTEVRWEGALDHLGPGDADGWAAYAAGVLWALREAGHDVPGLDVLVDGTVPLGAGLSSSAALECAVAVALTGLVGSMADAPRDELVRACMRAETEVAGAPTGGMDQTVAMHAAEGSALLIDFGPDDGPARPVPLALDDHVLLVTDTRVSHALGDGGYASRRTQCEQAAAVLGVASLRDAGLDAVEGLADEGLRRRARHVVTEIERVRRVVDALDDGDWGAVGALFAASHASMRDDFEISCDELDLAVEIAVQAGAVGARMTGGGFGGSSVAVVPSGREQAVVTAIDTAFARAGHRAPQHLRATPSAGAELV